MCFCTSAFCANNCELVRIINNLLKKCFNSYSIIIVPQSLVHESLSGLKSSFDLKLWYKTRKQVLFSWFTKIRRIEPAKLTNRKCSNMEKCDVQDLYSWRIPFRLTSERRKIYGRVVNNNKQHMIWLTHILRGCDKNLH